MEKFLHELSSKEPVPGGGGAAALAGAVSAALGAMVGNLTSGKKAYADYQEDIERCLSNCEKAVVDLYEFIEKDAKAFAPLAKAYCIPKDQPDRDQIMEKALLEASLIPLELVKALYQLVPVLEELEIKGSRLAVSDVAVASSLLRAALESAVMNVYINTSAMKDRKKAEELNRIGSEMVKEGSCRCQSIVERITEKIR